MPGFLRIVGQWWKDVVDRGDKSKIADTALIHGDKLWKAEDAQKYGDLVEVPCKREWVRVTRPEILHGSTPSGTSAPRCTIFPWYVDVREDGETLDNLECDRWSDFPIAQAAQTHLGLRRLVSRIGMLCHHGTSGAALEGI